MATAWPLVGFLRHGHWVGYWMGFYGMVTEWVSDARLLGRSLDGFRKHGHWVGFRGMATGWVSEAWLLGGSLDGFQRHGRWLGHWMGFCSMAT